MTYITTPPQQTSCVYATSVRGTSVLSSGRRLRRQSWWRCPAFAAVVSCMPWRVAGDANENGTSGKGDWTVAHRCRYGRRQTIWFSLPWSQYSVACVRHSCCRPFYRLFNGTHTNLTNDIPLNTLTVRLFFFLIYSIFSPTGRTSSFFLFGDWLSRTAVRELGTRLW